MKLKELFRTFINKINLYSLKLGKERERERERERETDRQEGQRLLVTSDNHIEASWKTQQ